MKLTANIPLNKSHGYRIYDPAAFKKAIEDYKERCTKGERCIFGTIRDSSYPTVETVHLGRISHKVTDIQITDNNCEIEIDVIDSLYGKIVQEMINNLPEMTYEIQPRMSCRLQETENGTEIVEIGDITSFDICPKQ